MLVCPSEAIREKVRPIGELRVGAGRSVQFVEGVLNVGEHTSPPAIRAVKQAAPSADLVVVDSPPGTACPVVESMRDCDLVLLVTEPTPFGLHDLRLAVETVRALKLPAGVVINRSGLGNGDVSRYCAQARIPVLAEIPDDRRVAEAYSQGKLAAEAVPGYEERFAELLERVSALVETI
jgi:MinD superfamily P-loop ATPase